MSGRPMMSMKTAAGPLAPARLPSSDSTSKTSIRALHLRRLQHHHRVAMVFSSSPNTETVALGGSAAKLSG